MPGGGFFNQVRMTITSSGTGTFTMGSAVAPFVSFNTAGIVSGTPVSYSAIDGTTGSEKGWGIYTSSDSKLTRNVFSSNNANNPIDASTLTQVFIDPSNADISAITFQQAQTVVTEQALTGTGLGTLQGG